MAKSTFDGPVESKNGFLGAMPPATATTPGGVKQITVPVFTDPVDVTQLNAFRDLLIASGLVAA